MKWTSESRESQAVKRAFTMECAGRRVPGVVWSPAAASGRRPLVLVGHGGSQHKESDSVLDVMQPLVSEHGFVVAAIDGPVHGARRADGGLDGGKVLLDFRAMWEKDPHLDEMTADWRATLDALAALPEVDPAAVGWFGVSMGTAYGLPLCATDPRIRAAMLGMWGAGRSHSDRLLASARQLRCPVLFQRKSEDERFSREGQEEMFNAIGSPDKELRVYEGLHVNPAGRQLDEGLAFLLHHLVHAREAIH